MKIIGSVKKEMIWDLYWIIYHTSDNDVNKIEKWINYRNKLSKKYKCGNSLTDILSKISGNKNDMIKLYTFFLNL